MSGLDVAVSTDGPGAVLVVRAEGEIDLSNADDLGAALASDEARTSSAVILDLLGVAFMDSSGLRVVLLAQRELEPELVLALQPGSPIVRLLELAEVSDRIRIFPSVEAAVEGAGPGRSQPS
jgi:anti-anti-sigma factor